MNKTLLVAGIALMFASAFVVIGGNGLVQPAHACPSKGNGASAQDSTPTNNLNIQLTPQSPLLISGQSA
jgi:hypothetical protein